MLGLVNLHDDQQEHPVTEESYIEDAERVPPAQTILPEQWPSDGPAVIAGLEEVSQDPDLFAATEVVEIFVEPEAKR